MIFLLMRNWRNNLLADQRSGLKRSKTPHGRQAPVEKSLERSDDHATVVQETGWTIQPDHCLPQTHNHNC